MFKNNALFTHSTTLLGRLFLAGCFSYTGLIHAELTQTELGQTDYSSSIDAIKPEKTSEKMTVHYELNTETGLVAQQIQIPEAEFIKVHFNQVHLESGDYILLTSDSGETQRIGYEDLAKRAEGRQETEGLLEKEGLWALSMVGEEISVEIHQGKSNASLGLHASLSIDAVHRGMSSTEKYEQDAFIQESICGNSDLQPLACANADSMVTNAAQAVARLAFPCDTNGGGGLCTCTAWRVGPRGDTMITNNHCISTAAQLSASEVFFNFQDNQCGSRNASYRQVGVQVKEILMTDYQHDVTLFTVRNPGRIARFGSLTLESQPTQSNTEIFIPQHPAGRAKEVSQFSDMDGGHCRINRIGVSGLAPNTDMTYNCDTEGGSSGSPVISRQTGRVVGLHHFGGCHNAGVRMDRIAPLVQPYLGANVSPPNNNPAVTGQPINNPPASNPTVNNPPSNPATTHQGEFGIQFVNGSTGILYHQDSGQTAAFRYLCFNGDCRSANRQNGRFEREVSISPGQSVEIEFKVENNGQQCVTGAIATTYRQQGTQVASRCA